MDNVFREIIKLPNGSYITDREYYFRLVKDATSTAWDCIDGSTYTVSSVEDVWKDIYSFIEEYQEEDKANGMEKIPIANFIEQIKDKRDRWEDEGLSDCELLEYQKMLFLSFDDDFHTLFNIKEELEEVTNILMARIKEGFYPKNKGDN